MIQLKIRDLISQLVQVLYAAPGFLRILRQKSAAVTGLLQDLLIQAMEIIFLCLSAKALHHFRKCTDLSRRSADIREVLRLHHHIIQAHVMGVRIFPHFHHGRITDPPSGNIDDPGQGLIIRRIGDTFQISHHIPDLLTGVEVRSPYHLIGNPFPYQLLLDHTGLGIGPVQHRQIRIAKALPAKHPEVGHDPPCFLPVIGIKGIGKLLSLFILRPEGLLLPTGVVGDDGICHIQDIGGGTVILFQTGDLRIRVLIFKIQDVIDVRSAELVNGLIIITHHAEIPVLCRQKLHQDKLGVIGILVLIHHDIAEALLINGQNIRMLHKEPYGLVDQIIKIQRVILLQTLLIFRVDIGHIPAPIASSFIPRILLRREEFLLRLGNGGDHPPYGILLLVQPQMFQRLLDDGLLIIRIVNIEIVLSPQLLVKPPQYAYTHGVKGLDPDLLRSVRQHPVHTLPHFLRRLVGEGDGKDIARVHALSFYEVGDPVGDHSCFSASCSR